MNARHAAVLAALAVPAGIFVGDLTLGPVAALVIVVGGLLLGSRYVPGFWRTLGRAGAAGGVAGILVLGPGYRLAMRVVAILDAATTPEFTLEGTMFLIVGIGAVFGAITTAWVTIITRTFDTPKRAAVTLLSAVVVGMLFLGSEVRTELTEMGAGPIVNVPMFLGVTVAWAWLADRWARPVRREDQADARLAAMPR